MASIDNPYRNVFIIKYLEGDSSLERYYPVFNNNLHKKLHTVMPGENIQSISNQYYGDSGSWYLIAEYNNIMDPFEELEVGMEIVIP